MGEGQQRLAEYESRVYPNGQFPPLQATAPETLSERKAWLQVFLLGVLQTLGNTRDEANRNFLKLCEQRRWMDHLAEVHRRPEGWLLSWDGYVEEQTQNLTFYQWMKQLIGLFVIARRLGDYVTAFLAINQTQHPFPLTQITQPRVSEIFQGGGPDAPPVSGILGIGACFVMRELVRHGIIENSFAHPYCYMPVRRVRSLVFRLGGPALETITYNRWERSRLIHEFLQRHLGQDRATFNGAFDIPLQIIAKDYDLQLRFFDTALPITEEPKDEEE